MTSHSAPDLSTDGGTPKTLPADTDILPDGSALHDERTRPVEPAKGSHPTSDGASMKVMQRKDVPRTVPIAADLDDAVEMIARRAASALPHNVPALGRIPSTERATPGDGNIGSGSVESESSPAATEPHTDTDDSDDEAPFRDLESDRPKSSVQKSTVRMQQRFGQAGHNNALYVAETMHIHARNTEDGSSVSGTVGIQFSLVDEGRRSKDLTSMRKDRLLAFTKRHANVSHLPDHLGAYQNLDVVKSPQIRHCLYRISRYFLQLDKMFAALFVDILQAEDCSLLSDLLDHVRQEITARHVKDRNSGEAVGKVFIGDLGRHCELLLEQHKKNLSRPPNVIQVERIRYQVSHGADEYLLTYLQNGLEIPYWRIMLDTFFTFRANKTTMGTDVLSLALHHMKSEVRVMRRQLQQLLEASLSKEQLLDASSSNENIKGILCGLDKRIEVLHSFTDNTISNAEEEYQLFEFMLSKPGETLDETADAAKLGNMNDFEEPVQPSPWLTAFTMVTMIAAFLPFIIGFATSFGSDDVGAKKDADYWYNISGCITVMFGNLTMVFPLLKGFWFSAPYMIMWLWFFASIIFSALSIGLYPNRNTCWSSACAFLATIAGFGATLNITMAVSKDRSKPRKLKPD